LRNAGALVIIASGMLPGSKRWWILHERARRHCWEGEGALSLKTFDNGRALYSVAGGWHAVDRTKHLVLNEGQRYRIEIDQPQPIESFCIFFGRGFVEEIARSRCLGAGPLVDQPSAEGEPIRFFERTYPREEALARELTILKTQHRVLSTGGVEERLHRIVELLLETREVVRREVLSLGQIRAGTREEIYRRVWRARDFADAMFAEHLGLGELSQAACLSPNHLLRTFREVFGVTPHRYLTRRRLEEAARLLRASEEPVTEICLRVGFQSVGSFSTLFKRQTGFSPSEFRARKK
jgi:AraC family transcriptional regulator